MSPMPVPAVTRRSASNRVEGRTKRRHSDGIRGILPLAATITAPMLACCEPMISANRTRHPQRGLYAICLMLLMLLPMSASVAGAETLPNDSAFSHHLQGLGDTRYHRLDASDPQAIYHLYVRLPEGYNEATAQRFPVIYLLDGGITFPLLAAYYRYLSLAEELPPMIVVGISYGTDDWRQGNQRSRDFTAPAPDQDHWGGAAAFHRLLEQELVPLVARHYRTDPQRRWLFGQSIGGQFVLYSALQRPGYFQGLIASNPALHRNLAFYLRPPETTGADTRPGALYVSSAEHDDPRFREPAMAWLTHWQDRPAPFRLKFESLTGHHHFSTAPQAFRQGLAWILEHETGADQSTGD